MRLLYNRLALALAAAAVISLYALQAFYMRLNPDDKTVAAMDLLVPRVGELIGGSQREERLQVFLTQAARECNMQGACCCCTSLQCGAVLSKIRNLELGRKVMNPC